MYTECLRDLDLATFRLMIAHFSFDIDLERALLINLCLPFLKQRPSKLDIFAVNQVVFCKTFLPHSANLQSSAANAKMSIVLESLLFNMFDRGLLIANAKLESTLEAGIKARQDRAVPDGRRKGKGRVGEEQEGLIELERSSQRMRATVALFKTSMYRRASGFTENIC